VSAVEEKIGVVTDYLNRVGVAVIRLTDGDLRLGDRVKITGRTTELTQTVESLSDRASGCGARVARHRGRPEGAGAGPPP
jgi:hypothetical protein